MESYKPNINPTSTNSHLTSVDFLVRTHSSRALNFFFGSGECISPRTTLKLRNLLILAFLERSGDTYFFICQRSWRRSVGRRYGKCYNIEKSCCGYVHTHALAYTVTDIRHRYVYTHRYAFHRYID